MATIGWVTEAPIFEINFSGAIRSAKAFESNLEHWSKGEKKMSASLARLDGAITASDQRIRSTKAILVLLKDFIRENRGPGVERYLRTYEYRLQAMPIAMMILVIPEQGPVVIEVLVAHPGSNMAGGAMIEFALNQIVTLRGTNTAIPENMLKLESADAESSAAYKALGFKFNGANPNCKAGDMFLDAGRSDIWTKISGKWRIRNYAKTCFLGDSDFKSSTKQGAK